MGMDFDRALQNGEFRVWYQPQVDLCTGELHGAEALVRWQRNGALLPPSQFLPDLERSGRIVELDELVLRTVCADVRRAEEQGVRMGVVSVNLSRMHLGRPDAASRIGRTARREGAKPEDIVFELTESVRGSDTPQPLMEDLRQMGFAISLDDYGTGFSTLKSLAGTEFDILKLDRFFVSRIGEPRADAIVRSTLLLAGSLGASVVAEGVETPEQARFLTESGCRTAQGFYFHRPMPLDEYLRHAAEGGIM